VRNRMVKLLSYTRDPFSGYHIYFENAIDKSNFILSIVEYDGGGEFCPKIYCFIQISVERVGDVRHEHYIEIIGHCVRPRQISTN
jgi:hypothetical protein